MNLIDKAMNRVIKWESIDVTIPEMVDLVQTEILEKASAKDLAELEKGMQKTFVLAVGGGSRYRYYPCWISVSMGNGNFYKDVQYEEGMGSLYMTNGTLCWEDYTGDNGASYFVPDNRPIFD